VNNITEPKIDQIIKEEVSDLLRENHMYESKLNKIDKRLEVIIDEARK